MNLLRECTFFDRDRNSQIELDDLLEEASQNVFNKNSQQKQDSTSTLDENSTTNTSSFYLILYFSADWLPEASNTQLNDKLRSFMEDMKIQTASQRNSRPVELVFVSSDKTSDSYWNFLDKFKFIRYSLAFQEKELKVNLEQCFKLFIYRYRSKPSLKVPWEKSCKISSKLSHVEAVLDLNMTSYLKIETKYCLINQKR